MFSLYTKVSIIIIIAYISTANIWQFYSNITTYMIILISFFAIFSVIFFTLKLGYFRFLKGLHYNILLKKISGYGIIFTIFTLLVTFRYYQTQQDVPSHSWDMVRISSDKNRKQFFLAEVMSMDGFKKERYRMTLKLISSHNSPNDSRWMTTIFHDFKKSSSPTNTSLLTNSRVIDYLERNLNQKLEFPYPITVYALSYLKIKDLDPGDFILLRPYFIRKTADLDERSSYKNYLIANGIFANVYYSPHDLIILEHLDPPLLFQVWEKIKVTIDKYIKYPSSTLAYAIFTGNKNEMPDYIKEYFRSTGTYHVLAVSGMHAGLLSIFFFYIFRILGMRKKTSLGLIFFTILPAYLILTNFQISIQRTYLMGLLGFFFFYFDRSVNLMTILCLSFIAITFYNPHIIYSVSFQLSFGAVFGIAHTLRLIGLYKSKNAFINGLWVSIGAQLGTLPVVIYYFGYNNFLSLLYNILVSFLITAYYLYTLLFLLITIPLSYFNGLVTITNFIGSTIGDFLTHLGNILFLFLHYTAVEFDWFYFPSLKNNLNYAMIIGILLFILAESMFRYRSHYVKKNIYKNRFPKS